MLLDGQSVFETKKQLPLVGGAATSLSVIEECEPGARRIQGFGLPNERGRVHRKSFADNRPELIALVSIAQTTNRRLASMFARLDSLGSVCLRHTSTFITNHFVDLLFGNRF